MARNDINKAFKNAMITSDKSHKAISQWTDPATEDLLNKTIKLESQFIPVENIRFRELNEFHDVDDNLELDESIRMYGLINPISVYCDIKQKEIPADQREYTISAGSRRYKAVLRLRDRYPGDPRFYKIEAKVYFIVSEEEKRDKHLDVPYITKTEENAIYRDSNNLARQLNDQDIASQMRYIIGRFENPDNLEKVRKAAEELNIKTYSNPDIYKMITQVMSSQNLWKREKTREYLTIYRADRDDLLDRIEAGNISVHAAYKMVIEEQDKKRKRTTNKIPSFVKSVQALAKEAETKNYTDKEIQKLKECKELIEKIIYQNK